LIEIEHNKDLTKFNTFAIKTKAEKFITFSDRLDLRKLYEDKIFLDEIMVLGGGSNILFTKNFSGTVISPNIRGIKLLSDENDIFYLKVNCSEKWDDVVNFSLEKNLWGLECLAGIPGKAGTAPVQNIGAYGTELKDVLENVEYFDFKHGKFFILENKECQFGYRDSIFKNRLKGKTIITSITIKLFKKQRSPILYEAINKLLVNIKNPTVKDIKKSVITLRNQKIPDPRLAANGGSFFKNPIINQQQFLKLNETINDFPFYRVAESNYKIPAAYLIEKCGWKGTIVGNVEINKNQPLVLINTGSASGLEIIQVAEKIRDSIIKKFNINLDFEINVI
jgi:UDP-N-acetylmuramate dehydrogenase